MISRPLNFSLLGLTLFLYSCTSAQKEITIEPLKMLNNIDTFMDRGKMVISKFDYYLISNYRDNKRTQNFIDSFVQQHKDSSIAKYSHYNIVFYRESSETNVKNILANPRVIDRYSQENDWIYSYHFINGKFLSRWKVKKGEIIEPKNNIVVEDIKLKDSLQR